MKMSSVLLSSFMLLLFEIIFSPLAGAAVRGPGIFVITSMDEPSVLNLTFTIPKDHQGSIDTMHGGMQYVYLKVGEHEIWYLKDMRVGLTDTRLTPPKWRSVSIPCEYNLVFTIKDQRLSLDNPPRKFYTGKFEQELTEKANGFVKPVVQNLPIRRKMKIYLPKTKKTTSY